MVRGIARRSWLVAALLVACGNQPSRLDPLTTDGGAGSPGSDPWSARSSRSGDDKNDKNDKNDQDDNGGLGGFDLKSALTKIAESVEKPGPYEAPEKSTDYDETKPHWGVLALRGGVVEREAFSFTGGHGTELRAVIDRLRDLGKDAKLTGLLLRVESIEISLPDVIELRAAVHDLRAAGKKVACHTEDASNAMYLALTACDRIGLAPLGQVAITGPAAMPIHVKALLDKLGITADFLHVGAYKGAAEPLTRDAPSKEMEETLGAILDRRYATMVEVIAKERKLDAATVKGLIDTALFPSDDAKAAKLVDDVIAFEAFRDQMAAGPWTKLELEPNGGKDQLQAMLKIARFIGAMPPEKPIGDHVAVVYALGNIVDGGGDGVLGARQEIASHTMVSALRAIAADDTVKAVVLRIDSGGGSAQASELIWEAVNQLKTKKPVVVSMSDVAASGGYYIASNATKIFALEDTLTGSIGVVGGKIAPSGALAKVGINTFPMGRGKRATIMASLAPWRDDEKAVIQASMEAVYKVFVGRVAEGRHKKLEDILPIAQGRVWTGTRAKELGLVDAIGGLDAALAEARTLGKVDASVGLEVYPPSPTLRDVLSSFGGVQAPLGLRSSASEAIGALRAVDPEVAAAAERLVDLVMSFRATTIQAVTIVPMVR
jgi:protease-4